MVTGLRLRAIAAVEIKRGCQAQLKASEMCGRTESRVERRAVRIRAKLLTLILACCSCFHVHAIAADVKVIEPLPTEALEAVEYVDAYRVSPDGQLVALIALIPRSNYVMPAADTAYDAFRGELRVIDVRTGAMSVIGPAGEDFQNPEWSPDSTLLAYVVGVDDQARLAVWSRLSDRSRVLSSRIPQTNPRILSSRPVWFPDGRSIVIGVLPAGVSNASLKRLVAGGQSPVNDARQSKTSEKKPGIRVFNSYENPGVARPNSNDRTPEDQEFSILNLYRVDLVRIDAVNGEQRMLLGGLHPLNYHISPDGRRISYVDLLGSVGGNALRGITNVGVLDINANQSRTLVPGVFEAGSPIDTSWSPNSRMISFFDGGEGAQHDCFLVDVVTGFVRRVGGSMHYALESSAPKMGKVAPPIWSTPTDAYALLGSDESKMLWHIALNEAGISAAPLPLPPSRALTELRAIAAGPGASRSPVSLVAHIRDPLTKSQGFAVIDPTRPGLDVVYERAASLGDDGISLNGNDRMLQASADGNTVAFLEQRIDAPPQLWVTDRKFRRPRQLTHQSRTITRYALGKSRVVQWAGPDGEKLEGALLLPPDFTLGKRYPLIVQLYGGSPLSNNVNTFGLTGPTPFPVPIQNLQIFATRGYAVFCADTIARVGRPMGDIAGSLLPGVNRVIEDGIADADRLAIMGHSYGGYSVLSVLVQTGRFKAAVVSAGTANLIESYGDMRPDGTGWRIGWVEDSQGRMGGSLWEQRERFIENSPLFFLNRVTTPVLLLQGTADTAVAVHEADEVFLSLRRLGKAARYVQYIGEDHTIVGTNNNRDLVQQILEWFGAHLRSASDLSNRNDSPPT